MQTPQLLQETQQQFDIFRPSIFEFGANLFIALFCGTLISLVYRFIRRNAAIPPAFPNALVLLSLITAIITLVIGNNLARAFGLVGTMSIIRFRTAVRDVEDIVFIFFSLAMGMAAGVGLNSIALIGTVLICVVILLLHAFSDPERKPAPPGFLLITHGDAALPQLQELLKKHGRRIKLLNTQQNGESLYQLALRRPKKSEEFLRELREVESVTHVNFFHEPEAKES